MNIYEGYESGYSYDEKYNVFTMLVKYGDEIVYSFSPLDEVKKENAFEAYKDWSGYLISLGEYSFLAEIGELK